MGQDPAANKTFNGILWSNLLQRSDILRHDTSGRGKIVLFCTGSIVKLEFDQKLYEHGIWSLKFVL
ncbi:unnamed protein product [Prunus armeniaca]|uniref:Uncharacterized protein n=1 Tax=Prunus armeniaca TaxID=36596 RepID=A0A6J5UV73_PRUAR|nr:unnamed protein product [Prunus armeniaca]